MNYPSIFNDVIGPIMRGPSSSHCAASLRIGRMARDLMAGEINSVLIEFDANGSLATTHTSQGSDMGLFGGLLGWNATDERLFDSVKTIREAGININIQISDYGANHPNTCKLTLANKKEKHSITAISVGGGMIELIELDGCPVSMAGDYYENLIFLNHNASGVIEFLKKRTNADQILVLENPGSQIIELKSQEVLDDVIIAELVNEYKVRSVRHLLPVLPVLSRQNVRVPFITCEEMLKYNEDKGLALWELALHYESSRGNLSHEQVIKEMQHIVDILNHSIQQGLKGTKYEDRILGVQSARFLESMKSNQLLQCGILNQIILYITSMMEVKSSMGVIVASPTAGSCGGLPGACIGAASAMGLPLEEATKAMLAGGLIGVFIAAHATFSAEVGGCQAECGAGSGMAAAALVTLGNGTTQQAVDASSIALQNILGMICDPVANRVEVPCLGKNVMAASNALTCANMALAGYDPVIPLDEVIETMDRVGKSIPAELRCTALGGLSITKTSRTIEQRLQENLLKEQ